MGALDVLKGLLGGGAPPAPTDAPSPDATSNATAVGPDGTYGVRVELTDDLKGAALDLVLSFESQSDESRRRQVEVVSKAYSFMEGDQYGALNSMTGLYAQIPTHTGTAAQSEANSAYVVNRYKAYHDTGRAIIIANKTTVKALPQNPNNPKSVKSAKLADQVLRLASINNDERQQLEDEWLHLWNGGTFGSYIRHVRDGARFGFTEEPVMEEFQIDIPETIFQGAADWGLGSQQPPPGAPPGAPPMPGAPPSQMGAPAAPPGAPPGPPGMPPSPLGPGGPPPVPPPPTPPMTGFRQATHPETGEPMVNKIPNGAEIKDVVGILELRLPPTAKAQWQFPYIGWATELPISLMKATYPDVAADITADDLGGTGEDTEERIKRLKLAYGTDVNGRQRQIIGSELVTFRRYWFRPWAFESIEGEDDTVKKQLQQLFPDGMFVAFAGSTLCEARNESMDDHWRICHANAGQGQVRSSIGKPLIAVQEMSNDILNFTRDAAEFGMSAIFADTDIVNINQFKQSRVRAGAIYPAKSHGEKPISQAFYSTPAAQISPQSAQLREELDGPTSQFLVGAFPAAFGGDTGENNTAHGIAIERDAAMGRMGFDWGTLKDHHADCGPLFVKAFVAGRTDPAILPVAGPGGKFKALEIDPNDIDVGEIAPRYSTLEDYPTSWPQQKDALTNLLQNPVAGPAIMQDLANIDEIKRVLGVSDVVVPGEVDWNKEMHVIDLLLQQQPIPVGPGLNPMTHMPDPTMPPQMGPSIPLDPVLDNPPVIIQAIKSWAASEEGQSAAMQNKGGYQNVRLRAQAAQMAMQPPPPPGAGGPPGAPGPHPGGPPGPPGAHPPGPPAGQDGSGHPSEQPPQSPNGASGTIHVQHSLAN